MEIRDFEQLADSLPEAMILLDSNGRILALNRGAEKLSGLQRGNLHDGNLSDLVNDSEEKLRENFRFWSRSRSPLPTYLDWKCCRGKSTPKLPCSAFLLRPGNDTQAAWIVLRFSTAKPIAHHFMELNTELENQRLLMHKLQLSRMEMEREREKAQVTLHCIADAVITTDDKGRIEYLNPVAERLTGWQNDKARGKKLARVFNIINEITRQPADNPVKRCLERGNFIGLANHTVLISDNGTEYVIEDSAAPIRDRDGTVIGAVLIFRDVTGDRLAQRQLEYLAQHDTLTGLKNRYYFSHQLEQAVRIASRKQRKLALLYIDLDEFKLINDSAGHAAGDELLIETARRLLSRLRQGDTLARLGGDEFGIILNDMQADDLNKVASSFVNAMKGFVFQWRERRYQLGCSIGAVLLDENITTPAEALRQADIACYHAKHAGRNRAHVYSIDDHHAVSAQGESSVLNEIHHALDHDAFVLVFQPICRTGGEVVMHEALLRMSHDNGELISPGKFIPIAERFGIMNKIDRWVISQVWSILQRMSKDNSIQLSINLSGTSLEDDSILKLLTSEAKKHPQAARRFLIEISETTAVTHADKTGKFIKQLHALGIRFALDDFGTGFSSFAYLKHLPVDIIKIDGTFVRDIADDPIDQAMVRSINHIAHSLGKQTVAEFVESEQILILLKDMGVNMVQGNHVGMPAELFKEKLN